MLQQPAGSVVPGVAVKLSGRMPEAESRPFSQQLPAAAAGWWVSFVVNARPVQSAQECRVEHIWFVKWIVFYKTFVMI